MGRYLPAHRVQAGTCRLGDVTVRADDGRELGKLLGFVVDPHAHRILSLVVESGPSQLEIPMGALQLDQQGRALRVVDGSSDSMSAISADALPIVEDADLWVPLFHSAA